MNRLHKTAAALLCAGTLLSAQAQEARPARLPGSLQIRIETTVRGKAAGVSEMNLAMLSAATAPAHVLMKGPDDDMARENERSKEIGAIAQSGFPDQQQLRNAFALLDTCRQDEQSASCQQGKARVQAANEQMDRTRERMQAREAAVPSAVHPHRYQSWTTNYVSGCGSIRTQWLEAGRGVREARLPANDRPEGKLAACGTELVIDRRANQATLRITPLNIGNARDGKGRSHELFNFNDMEEGGAEVEPRLNAIVIRNQPLRGSPANFSGSTVFRGQNGTITTVEWKFTEG